MNDSKFWERPWFREWLRLARLPRVLSIAAALLLTLPGCKRQGPTTPPTPVTISSSELTRIFENNGIWTMNANSDAFYAVPTLDWFENQFPRDWGKFTEMFYRAENRDCDDFARGAAWYAQNLHGDTLGAPERTGLSVGEFWYTRLNGSKHAIVAAVCRISGSTNLVLAFMEPQKSPNTTPAVINLSKSEYQSCYERRF